MDRRPSPRPTFEGPAHIPRDKATLHLWGDTESGLVSDRIYVSSEKVHQLELSLPSGGSFRHSENNRTYFAADELFVVLQGTLAIANPETGEVHRVRTGEAVFFRRDTWHHGFSVSEEVLRVLEYFCPPPAQGTSSSYAMKNTNLQQWQYTDDEKLGSWPMEEEQWRQENTMKILRDEHVAWRLEGPYQSLLVGLLVSTENMTAGKGSMLPGRQSGIRGHSGDTAIFLISGNLHVHTPNDGPPSWFEMEAGDGFYIPEASKYELFNYGASTAEWLFGTAPDYLIAETT